MNPSPASDPATVGNVVVTFFTTTCDSHMPEQTFSIPLNTLPEGLQKLVDSVLGAKSSTPFDFLVNDEYISTTLEKFIRRRSINMEEILPIEYTPALQSQEGNKMPHDDWVSSIRAPQVGDASLLVTGAYDHCVRVWSSEECVAIGSKHVGAVKEVALHPVAPAAPSVKTGSKRSKDNAVAPFRFVSGAKDGRVCAWEYSANKLVCTGSALQHVGSVESVDVSPGQGSLVASGSWDQTVKVFDWAVLSEDSVAPDKKAPLVSFSDHARAVLSCRFSQHNDGVHLYSTGLDGTIKIWDLSKMSLVSTLHGDHSNHKMSVKPGGGSDLLLVGSTDNRIRLYDPRQKTVAKTFSSHRQWVYSVAWFWRRDEEGVAPLRNDLFASASEDSTLRTWDLRCTTAPLVTQEILHTDGILDVTYVGNATIASGGKDNKTKTFTLTTK